MNTIENENIDVSEWLPRSFAEEYPHRVKQLGRSPDHSTYRYEYSILPIDMLLERHIVTGDQHRAAIFVATLRRAINNSLGTDRVYQAFFREGVVETSVGVSPSLMLQLALQGLDKWQMNLLDKVITLPRYSSDSMADIGWLSHCLTSVKKTLDDVRKNIDNHLEPAKNNHSEGSTSVS